MCCGSAARRRFGAADHALAQVNLFFYWGGGGVVRLTAKPRYLLLLHRGNEKSNTVTALHWRIDSLQKAFINQSHVEFFYDA